METIKHRLNVKRLELDSMLEITQAINNNLPEDSIYKIYNFTLRANLNISKLALYVLDETWECKVNFGTVINFYNIPLPDPKLFKKGTAKLNEGHNTGGIFDEFDLVIPVTHKNVILAYVFVGDGKSPDEKQEIDTVFVQTLSNIVIVAVENKKLARKQLRQEALNREIEIAQQVQSLLFPRSLPYTATLKVKAGYFPHRSIGGDYYDFIEVSKHEFLVCIADVSGKGIPAAILMSNFQASLRTMVRQTNNLKRIIEELNYLIYQNARGENFITFFAMIYNRKLRRFTYVNAGHNPPIMYQPDKGLSQLERGTTILGAFNPLPFLEETVISDVADFTLLCYTDGLTEARDEHDEEFGPERLMEFMVENATLDPDALQEKLIATVDAYKSDRGYDDDVTLVTCKVSDK